MEFGLRSRADRALRWRWRDTVVRHSTRVPKTCVVLRGEFLGWGLSEDWGIHRR